MRKLVISFFSERELNVHVRYMLSPVRPSVCRLLSVMFVRPTEAVQIFGNISTALGTLAPSIDIHWKFYGDRRES